MSGRPARLLAGLLLVPGLIAGGRDAPAAMAALVFLLRILAAFPLLGFSVYPGDTPFLASGP